MTERVIYTLVVEVAENHKNAVHATFPSLDGLFAMPGVCLVSMTTVVESVDD